PLPVAAPGITGRLDLSHEPRILGVTVHRLVNTMKMTGLVAQHPVDVDVCDVWINADAMRLEQIVNNLVTNAVKYSSEQGRIQVIVQKLGERARLQVIDEGA